MSSFLYNISALSNDPAPTHFAEVLEAVVEDTKLKPFQADPLQLIEALTYPVVFTKKAMLSSLELALKDAVDKRFITYVQVVFFICATYVPITN